MFLGICPFPLSCPVCWHGFVHSSLFNDLFFFFKHTLFIFWLCWFFVSVRGLSPVVASGGHSSSRCTGLSLSRPLVAEHSYRHPGSVVVAHGPSCSAATGSRAQLLRGMWDLPRPGLEPMSPASAGRLSTTAPPGKPYLMIFYISVVSAVTFLLFISDFIYLNSFHIKKN